MSDKKPLSGRGGNRKGSGRPSVFTKPKAVKVQIEQDDFDAIERADHNVPEYMRNAMLKQMKKDKLKP